MTEIIFEARDEELLADPRLDAYEAFADWLVANKAIELPDGEVIVEVVDGEHLPTRPYKVPSGKAVGCFCIKLRSGFPRYWLVALALGGKEQHSWEQEDRLVTLAHELLHVSEFWKRHGQTPGVVAEQGGAQQLLAEMRRPEGDEVEEKARHLTWRYLGYA